MKKLSKSRALAAKVIFAAFQILKENGGELNGREVIEKVGNRVELDDWAKSKYEKSGYIRWQSILHFFSIDCIKAGYLIKKKGTWYLTPEGEASIDLGEAELLESATRAYRKWKKEKEIEDNEDEIDDTSKSSSDKEQEATIDEIEQIALDGIKSHIRSKNPYEFQDLVAALSNSNFDPQD